MVIPGGHSAPRAPSQSEIDFLTSEKVLSAMKRCSGFEAETSNLVPVSITTQVVAGTVYQVKYKVGGDNGGSDKYLHAKIFEPLPCYPDEVPELMNFKDNCTVDEPLAF